MQIREHLEQLVESALQAAIDDHTLELDEVPEAALERPRDLSNGADEAKMDQMLADAVKFLHANFD